MEAQAVQPDPPSGDALEFPMRGEENQNPAGISLFALLCEDLRTHESLFVPGFWVLAVNRLGNARMGIPRKCLRAPLSLLYEVLYGLVLWTCRIELPYIVKVGRRVRIWHFGCSVLGARSIGDDVQFRHNVTLGLANHGDPIHRLPIIEERVIIGAGAAILGPIRVGHDSIIGANSVVTKDVPPHSLVAGIPGRVLRTLGASELTTTVRTRA